MNASQIIKRLGGTAEVARLCEVKPPSVSEWKRVGIPRAREQYLRLLKPEAFIAEKPPTQQGEAVLQKAS